MLDFRRFNQCLQICLLSVCCGVPFVVIAAWAEPAVKTVGKYAFDRFVVREDDKTLIRYGNWYGPGWWGGSELDARSGMRAPIDSLDSIAQKHDFGYLMAEKIGKGRPDVEAYYKAMADVIAAREAMALPDDPRKWPHPAPNPQLASTYLERIRFGFPNIQQKLNEFKSALTRRADIADMGTLNRMLDGDPDEKKFEEMVLGEVKQWKKGYAKLQKKKEDRLFTELAAPNQQSDSSSPGKKKKASPKEIMMENLRRMNHTKIEAVFKSIGFSSSLNFFNCVCRTRRYGSSTASQYYHPGTIGDYNPKYSCNHPGDPCIVSGGGCLRYPLPQERKYWDPCLEAHRANMDLTPKGDVIPGTGTRIDDLIMENLRQRKKKF
jgi:hypothetical protein